MEFWSTTLWYLTNKYVQYIIIIRTPFPVFKDNSYYVQFLSLIINLNYVILMFFYSNFPSSKNYDHTIHRLGITLFIEVKVILSA